MAVLIEIRNASKRYGDQVLLDATSATLTDDGKIGFIGRNGAGKSTLLRIILGEEELDSGEVVRHPRLRIGHLRQHDPFLPGETVIGFLERDSGRPAWKCGAVAGRFEIKGAPLAGPVAALSGGWQTRVKLAALLLHEPNLLLLDEPTNFLDLRTQILLEHFLRSFDEACLIVSHDRAFLMATCERTLDLSAGQLTVYPGKVDAFLSHDRERRLHAERTNAAVLARRRHLEDFIARNKARASTASRARSKSRQLERLEIDDVAATEPTAAIRCPVVSPRRGPAVRCRGLSIGHGDRVVAAGIDVEVEHGTRAAIVGDNGQGKTTFLRTLVGSLVPIAGAVRWGHGCDIGVYAQHVYTSLPAEETVLGYLERGAAIGTPGQRILDLAGAMLFRGRAVEKRIAVLSGGERARLCLAGLLLGPANVLVLDEPGNHLDVETVDALAAALMEYAGTVIFTSHDRSFVQTVATAVIEVGDSRVRHHGGGYADYLALLGREADALDAAAGGVGRPGGEGRAGRGGRPAGSGQRDGTRRNDRDLRKELATLERKVAALDAAKRRLDAALLVETDPAAAVRLHEAVVKAATDLAAAEERWLAVSEELGGE